MQGPCSVPLLCRGWSDNAIRAETSRILLNGKLQGELSLIPFIFERGGSLAIGG